MLLLEWAEPRISPERIDKNYIEFIQKKEKKFFWNFRETALLIRKIWKKNYTHKFRILQMFKGNDEFRILEFNLRSLN